MSYFRSICKTQYQRERKPLEKDVLLTRAVDLEYEKYCLFFYEQVLCFLKISLEKGQPLEGDEHVYDNDESMSWE